LVLIDEDKGLALLCAAIFVYSVRYTLKIHSLPKIK